VGPKGVWILWDIERLFLYCPARAGDRGTILRCSSPQARLHNCRYRRSGHMDGSLSI